MLLPLGERADGFAGGGEAAPNRLAVGGEKRIHFVLECDPCLLGHFAVLLARLDGTGSLDECGEHGSKLRHSHRASDAGNFNLRDEGRR